MTDPQQAIAAVEAQATRHQTPCAEGALTWRRWGKGDDVLLLHGGSGSWLHWLRTIPALAERFSVWAPDLPGMGDSAPPPEPPHFDTYCATVLEGFKALRPGDAPVSLVGFSFGSSIAVRLAASLPAKHLVLSGANFAVQTQRPRRNLISLRRAPAASSAPRMHSARHARPVHAPLELRLLLCDHRLQLALAPSPPVGLGVDPVAHSQHAQPLRLYQRRALLHRL